MATKEDNKSTKKTSSYSETRKKRDPFDVPAWFDKSKYAHRWINADVVNERSDGYDPRGWVVSKDPEGKPLRYKDVILAQMPIEEAEERRQEKIDATKLQTESVLGNMAHEVERLSHEVKKLGGKIRFNLDID